jgi:hypothetical protein
MVFLRKDEGRNLRRWWMIAAVGRLQGMDVVGEGPDVMNLGYGAR